MTSPYRALPVVPTTSRAVCLYCVHVHVAGPYDFPKCRARRRVARDPVRGSVIKDDLIDCSLLRFDDDGRERECNDFVPTAMTRLLRAIGGRR